MVKCENVLESILEGSSIIIGSKELESFELLLYKFYNLLKQTQRHFLALIFLAVLQGDS